MAKTAAERKRDQRERAKEATNISRIDVTCHVHTAKLLAAYADYHEVTMGEAVDKAAELLRASIPRDEMTAILRNAEARELLQRRKAAGDTRTGNLFD